MTIWGLQDKGFLRRKKTWSYGVIDILKKFGELCSQFNNLCYKVHCNSLTFFTLEHLSRTRVHMFRKKCLILLYVTYLLLGVGKYVRMALYIKSHWTFNRIFIFDFHSHLTGETGQIPQRTSQRCASLSDKPANISRSDKG